MHVIALSGLAAFILACPAIAQPPEAASEENIAEPPAAEEPPPTRITIGDETTRIALPLREDGYVDYAAALDERAGAGVPAEENAMAGYLQVLGPEVFRWARVDERFYEALGIEPLPEDGSYYRSLRTFLEEGHDLEREELDEVYAATEGQYEHEEFIAAPSDHPLVRQWLLENSAFLDQAVAASHRPHAYLPVVSYREDEYLLESLEPCDEVKSGCRDLFQGLILRSLYRATEGDVEGALQDMHAAELIGRQVPVGGHQSGPAFALFYESTLARGKSRLYSLVEFTPEQAARLREDWESLPTTPSLLEHLDTLERYVVLHTLVKMAAADHTPTGGLDYNLAMRRANEYYDALCAALENPDLDERRNAFGELYAQLEDRKKQMENPTVAALMFATSLPQEVFAEKQVNDLLRVLSPGDRLPYVAEHVLALRELQRTAIALAEYRAREGEYPETLEALVPAFLEEAPRDRLADTPLPYERVGEGYRMYGIGWNNRDDGGQLIGEEGSEPHFRDDVFRVAPQ